MEKGKKTKRDFNKQNKFVASIELFKKKDMKKFYFLLKRTIKTCLNTLINMATLSLQN